jgi:hypothetical protein
LSIPIDPAIVSGCEQACNFAGVADPDAATVDANIKNDIAILERAALCKSKCQTLVDAVRARDKQ